MSIPPNEYQFSFQNGDIIQEDSLFLKLEDEIKYCYQHNTTVMAHYTDKIWDSCYKFTSSICKWLAKYYGAIWESPKLGYWYMIILDVETLCITMRQKGPSIEV